jgi:N,N'-diacetyllegionaminate synthase
MEKNNKYMKTIIIAEAGVNHNGKLENAKKLIKKAAEAGADYVKFQIYKTENLVTKKARKAKYQKINSKKEENQFEMLKKFELNVKHFKILKKICKAKKIKFLSSSFDIESTKNLLKLGTNIFKIPSGEITNLPYLKFIGGLKKKVILSTGMSSYKEILNAVKILTRKGTKKKNITILHCNSEYPTPYKDVNLSAMRNIQKKFGTTVGLSDHSLGTEVPIAAVALGAKVIEKHFTLNKNSPGPDHKSSVNFIELKKMIKSIRNIEKSLGDGIKKVSKSERKNIVIIRKSIVAKVNITKGERFSYKNLTTKRPGNGLSPMKIENIIGKKAKKNFFKDQQIY